MHNPKGELIRHLVDFFTIDFGNKKGAPVQYGNVFHPRCGNDELDMRFAADPKHWLQFIKMNGKQMRNESGNLLPNAEAIKEMIDRSKDWIFPLEHVVRISNLFFGVRFQRAPIVSSVLRTILEQGDAYGEPKPMANMPKLCLNNVFANEVGDTSMELKKYRAYLLHGVVQRLLKYSTWDVVNVQDATEDTLMLDIELCSREKRLGQDDDAGPKKKVHLLCGPVMEPNKKTPATMDSASYISLRTIQMMDIQEKRYSVYTTSEERITRLGHDSVTVDLLEVRHSSPVSIVRNGRGRSKGASFILYNSARLETLLREFDNRVATGFYDKLPSIETIDLSVLEDQFDWQLIFDYLLGFPTMLETVLMHLADGRCDSHLLISFIDNMTGFFSRYYYQKKVLVDNRAQLMPVMYARIYLIKATRQVLNLAMALLGMDPMDYL